MTLAGGACRSTQPTQSGSTPSQPLDSSKGDVAPTQSSIVKAMTAVADWQLANPSNHKLWEWHQAPFWASLHAFAPLSKDPKKYLDAIAQTGEANGWNHGPNRFHADDQAITQSYFLLSADRREPRMIAKALALFDEMKTMPFDESLVFDQTKTAREWVWCDALFMAPPALCSPPGPRVTSGTPT